MERTLINFFSMRGLKVCDMYRGMGRMDVKLSWHGIQTDSKIAELAQSAAIRKNKLSLVQEICEAHRNWVCAQAFFEVAHGIDQIDYAIYMLEATEKRYDMLLKQAKELPFSPADKDSLLEVRACSSSM
jgi:hypothetical protein